MKLIDLLVKELPRLGGWPDGALNATQDKDGQVCFSAGAVPEFGYAAWEGGDWCGNEFYTTRASDYDTAIVTREQYESALAASKAVAYRLQQPTKSEQVRADAAGTDDEADLNECIGQDFDVINHPSHYTKGRIECIDAIDSATVGKTGIEAVAVANVIKYLWRYEEKGGLESVRKAKWYLNKLISELESN